MNRTAENSTRGDLKIVLSTVSSKEEALRIARTLVEKKLAACVNIVEGVHSIYRWQDKVEDAAEVLLLIKTTEDSLAALEVNLKTLHSYELPEFLVLTPSQASDSYLHWIQSSVR